MGPDFGKIRSVMIFHYLKVLLRTLRRNKTYTALNLLGLTGGPL